MNRAVLADRRTRPMVWSKTGRFCG